jgi:hypothetical protein
MLALLSALIIASYELDADADMDDLGQRVQ